MAISYKKIINGDARYSKLNNKTWCFTLPIYKTSFISSIYVLICDISKYILISMLDHNVELQICLQLFSNITNKHIYRANKWSFIDRKCKTSSFVVKFRIPSITINNLLVWNCHFIKIDAQNFGDTTDRKTISYFSNHSYYIVTLRFPQAPYNYFLTNLIFICC